MLLEIVQLTEDELLTFRELRQQSRYLTSNAMLAARTAPAQTTSQRITSTACYDARSFESATTPDQHYQKTDAEGCYVCNFCGTKVDLRCVYSRII